MSRSFGPVLDTLIAGVGFTPKLEPRFVVEIRMDGLNILSLTSHADVSWSTGTVVSGVLTGDISSISQEIFPEEYRTTIGSLSFEIIDPSAEISADFGAFLTSGLSFGEARVSLYMGALLPGASSAYMYETPVVVQDIDRVEYDRARGAYRVRCADRWGKARKKIFAPRRTRLREGSSFGFNETAFLAAEEHASFQMVPNSSEASDAPLTTAGYVRFGDEIIRYVGKTDGVDTFNTLERQRFGTPREPTYTYDATTRQPEISEVVYFEEDVGDAICLVLTGARRTGPVIWPDHWHAGLDRDTDLQADSFITSEVARFVLEEEQTARTFIESELLPIIGSVVIVEGDGRLALRRLAPALNDGAFGFELTEANLRGVDRQTYDVGAIRNQFEVAWSYDNAREEFTRRALTLDSASITRNGASDLDPIELRGLHGSRHTEQTIDAIINWRRERLTDPPLRLSVTGIGWACRLTPGDVARLNVAGMPDFAGEDTAQIDRSYEVRRVDLNLRTLRSRIQLFGSTSKPVPQIDDTGGPVMLDSFYPSEGTPLPNVSSGVLTGDVALVGGSDVTDAASIWYVDGDLEIPVGLNVTISGNVQLRVRGTLTVNGTIEGTAGGLAGVAAPSSPPVVDEFQAGLDINPDLGTAGFIGRTQGSAPYASALLETVPVGYVPGDTYAGTTDILYRYGVRPAPITEGQNTEAVRLALVNTSGTSLGGLPTDIRGTSGGPGQYSTVLVRPSGPMLYYAGGAGGASGAGLLVVCRGLAVGLNGAITLDGASGSAGQVISRAGWSTQSGGGAPGSGGACYVLLDGSGTTETGLATGFRSRSGAHGASDATLDLVEGSFGLRLVDISRAASRVQYIPPPSVPIPDRVRAPNFDAEVRPSTFLIEEDLGGSIATAVADFNAVPYAVECTSAAGVDVSSDASFAVDATGGPGTISVAVDPTTGIIALSDLTGTAFVTFQATIRGESRRATVTFVRVVNGTTVGS